MIGPKAITLNCGYDGGLNLMVDILSLNIDELQLFMKDLGQPAYRAVQVFEWLHQRFPAVSDEAFLFEKMNNLPQNLRNELEKQCLITSVNLEKELRAKDGTVKFLLAVGGEPASSRVYIESVLMEYTHGNTVCISTQAGCKMGCIFCATGHSGFLRNLSAGEMCMQVYAVKRPVRNVVLMGCGEPLDNFDATLRFIELITHPKGAGLSQRHITLSTCGLVPEILTLAKYKMQITLAISLHGPDDDTRQALMPIAKNHAIKDLIAACHQYANTTRRRITFEYALTEGVNDSPAQARALANLLKGLLCHVNLIPVNQVGLTKLSPTKKHEAATFASILQAANIPTTIRRTIGAEVNAACGQLRAANTDSKLKPV
ncbi:MAG: 23S rRNA (adenine(2503)-C(2))-methyltransferase RlmN [Defluviitaleaceae bacterium]|nr:23S rRNA (adenine(2503)-C(2))-methyltransferase RlmN [Defluviitaleaceae bacterium]